MPQHLTIYEAGYALDGGSTTLYSDDEHGLEHRIFLPRTLSRSATSRTLGLFYFDGELIPVRSVMESTVLRLLREAELAPRPEPGPGVMKLTQIAVAGEDLERLVRASPGEGLRYLVDSVIDYVESDAYAAAGGPRLI